MSQHLNTFAAWYQRPHRKKAYLIATKEISQMSTLSPRFVGFFLEVTQTENAQRTKCIKEPKCGCETVGGRHWQWSLKEELETCKQFLVAPEKENARHGVFNFAMALIDAHNLSQKPDTMFEKLKYAVKLIVACSFVHKNVEDGTFGYFYAHENNTLLEPSRIEATKEDLVNIKNVLKNTDVIEACTKERANTKWKFHKLSNFTVSAALLNELPMGCEGAVLPGPLTRNHTIICPTYEESTRELYNETLYIFRAIALYLHRHEGFEDLLMEQWLESLSEEVLANFPTLFDCCDTTVTFVMYSTSMLFLKLIVARRVINLLIKLKNWRGIWQLAKTS